ncbi:glycosyltransferase family 2 protein [Methylicorpusculum oleiharenae]|uniref:glycosyltransferase family 2 protein n=1 Tax=Methylicorpusculum oleiharenae TaxID=1338687 RepID=UPI0038B3EE98
MLNLAMRPSISVIIPTYNGQKYIKQAIDSTLVQTFPALEIIIVDDDSNDETENIINRYGDQFFYMCQNNKGPACDYNTGISPASYRYNQLY